MPNETTVTWPRILLSFEGQGWQLHDAVLTLRDAQLLRNMLDSAIDRFEANYAHLPGVAKGERC